jgi:hypothetical protein
MPSQHEIDYVPSICCVNGQWAGNAISTEVSSDLSAASTFYTAYSSSLSTALSADVSKVSTFVSANSESLHNDFTSMSSSLAAFASTFTPPPDPFAKRDTVTIHKSIISNDVDNWRNNVDNFEATWVPPTTTWSIPNAVYTWTPPPHPDVVIEKRETVTVYTSRVKSVLDAGDDNIRHDINNVKATFTPPPVPTSPPPHPDVIFDKRAVSVVSHGLTCYGQAVVTLSASDAASLISSATSAASGTLYHANGSTMTPATATKTKTSSTSTSTAGAAIHTRFPMLAVGGVVVAVAFAAM